MLLPRLLLHRPPRSDHVSAVPPSRTIFFFAAGQWVEPLEHSQVCADQAASASQRWRRCDPGDDPQRRADRAETLVQVEDLPADRHALEGAPVATGTDAKVNALSDPLERPPIPRDPLPDDLFEHRGPVVFLDANMFREEFARCTQRQRWRFVRDDVGASAPFPQQRSRHSSVLTFLCPECHGFIPTRPSEAAVIASLTLSWLSPISTNTPQSCPFDGMGAFDLISRVDIRRPSFRRRWRFGPSFHSSVPQQPIFLFLERR